MDVLRKELNSFYYSQHLEYEKLDIAVVEACKEKITCVVDVTCDIVENVHLYRWKELSEACNKALSKWRVAHRDDSASKWTDNFYMTGDFDCASIDYKPQYAEAGFSSMVNFYFPKQGDLDNIVYTWQAYSDSVAAYDNWHPFSYLNNSYNRDTNMDNMINCATTLLLAPGIAQIFYGDETGRGLSDAQYNVDSNQAFRSDMNWNDVDSVVLQHFKKLGTIRKKHPTLISGKQSIIDNHTCVRIGENENFIIRLRPENTGKIIVSKYFKDGDIVKDLYTGNTAIVKNGIVKFKDYKNSISIVAKI